MMPLIFLLVPLGLLILFLTALSAPSGALYFAPWVPELGVNFSFSLNAISLFMAVLITAIGTGIGDGDAEGAFNLEKLRYHKIIIMTSLLSARFRNFTSSLPSWMRILLS